MSADDPTLFGRAHQPLVDLVCSQKELGTKRSDVLDTKKLEAAALAGGLDVSTLSAAWACAADFAAAAARHVLGPTRTHVCTITKHLSLLSESGKDIQPDDPTVFYIAEAVLPDALVALLSGFTGKSADSFPDGLAAVAFIEAELESMPLATLLANLDKWLNVHTNRVDASLAVRLAAIPHALYLHLNRHDVPRSKREPDESVVAFQYAGRVNMVDTNAIHGGLAIIHGKGATPFVHNRDSGKSYLFNVERSDRSQFATLKWDEWAPEVQPHGRPEKYECWVDFARPVQGRFWDIMLIFPGLLRDRDPKKIISNKLLLLLLASASDKGAFAPFLQANVTLSQVATHAVLKLNKMDGDFAKHHPTEAAAFKNDGLPAASIVLKVGQIKKYMVEKATEAGVFNGASEQVRAAIHQALRCLSVLVLRCDDGLICGSRSTDAAIAAPAVGAGVVRKRLRQAGQAPKKPKSSDTASAEAAPE